MDGQARKKATRRVTRVWIESGERDVGDPWVARSRDLDHASEARGPDAEIDPREQRASARDLTGGRQCLQCPCGEHGIGRDRLERVDHVGSTQTAMDHPCKPLRLAYSAKLGVDLRVPFREAVGHGGTPGIPGLVRHAATSVPRVVPGARLAPADRTATLGPGHPRGAMLETLRNDYERHGGQLRHTGLWAVAVYRFGRWATDAPRPTRWAAAHLYGALSLGVEVGLGVVVPRATSIGRDLRIVHGASIRIHPDTVIGDRVTIMHEVTLGLNGKPDGQRSGAPRIGNDVFIGVGARILGPVTIGDGATIAANSLVVTDVPAGSTAVGVPARVMRSTG